MGNTYTLGEDSIFITEKESVNGLCGRGHRDEQWHHLLELLIPSKSTIHKQSYGATRSTLHESGNAFDLSAIALSRFPYLRV
jgi:hypothetical protein